MILLLEAWEAVQDFLDLGGPVLKIIFVVTFAMWTLILERMWYFRRGFRKDRTQALSEWRGRTDRSSWLARQVEKKLVSEIGQKLNHSLSGIQTLVAVCPLFGILGTISGMITVFHIMSVSGNSNPRAMAGGVAMVTIPTMAGLVASLSGLFFRHRMSRLAKRELTHFMDELKSC